MDTDNKMQAMMYSSGCGEIPAGLDLWLAPLVDTPENVLHAASLLSVQERARFDRILDRGTWRRRVLARSALREVLATYLDADAAAVPLGEAKYGKPVLAVRGGPAFNLSHSGDLVAIGVGSNLGAVGVDIELADGRLRSRLPLRALSLAEVTALSRRSPDAREVSFLRYWTAKEAYAKGLGLGLRVDMRSIEIEQEPFGPTVAGDDGDWRLAYFDPRPDVIGAVATRGGSGV